MLTYLAAGTSHSPAFQTPQTPIGREDWFPFFAEAQTLFFRHEAFQYILQAAGNP